MRKKAFRQSRHGTGGVEKVTGKIVVDTCVCREDLGDCALLWFFPKGFHKHSCPILRAEVRKNELKQIAQRIKERAKR